MDKRQLGSTGLSVSILGFGGFHLVEIPSADATRLLSRYLDEGGNYIETAAGYGDGISEAKIGAGVGHRREHYILATKSGERTRAGFLAGLTRSLKALRTDHVDVMFMHAVQSPEDVDAILAPGGAMEGAIEAREKGMLRFIAISGHGRPDALLRAVSAYRFDVLMTIFNYLDRFNFPSLENELVPLCIRKGTAVLAMKALGDGYLFRSPVNAFRYTLGLPVSTVVTGINSEAMLTQDLAIARDFIPLTEGERDALYRDAPELGSYVCRLCGACKTPSFDPQKVFLLEGLFDRQMDDMRVTDTARYALQERLKHWFQQQEKARAEYAALPQRVDPARDYTSLSALCPFGIDINRKLKIAHGKLSMDRYIA